MLYHCLKFVLINILLLSFIWLIVQQWHDKPSPQSGLQIIEITPLSNQMMTEHCQSYFPTTTEIAIKTADKQIHNDVQNKPNCTNQKPLNHYLIWYQYQGQEYQTLLNDQADNDLYLIIPKKIENGYF